MRGKLVTVVVTALLLSGLTLYRSDNDSERTGAHSGYGNLDMDEVSYDVTESDLNRVVEGNNEFAFDLYHELDPDDNLFFSPWSISSAMAMTYEGSAGVTAQEMEDVFGFTENRSEMRKAYGFLHNRYNTNDTGYEINTANSAWVNEDYPVLEEYKFILINYYFSQVEELDFFTDPSEACDKINQWVSDNTNGTIRDIISEQDINRLTQMVLANAIYFNGKWSNPFNGTETRHVKFYTADEREIGVPFMRQEGIFNYTDDDDFQILKKNYEGNDVSMLFILPKEDNLAEVKGNLTLEKLDEWRDDLEPTSMRMVSIPKFDFETEYNLQETLEDLGTNTLFDGRADLSGIDGAGYLFLDYVKHNAFIEVDEKGTEAAAVTIGGARPIGIDRRPKFHANRPFLFLIQDNETGNILFMGRVNDPSE